MAVPIQVKLRGQLYTFHVERWKCVDGFEYFHIITKSKTIAIKCNRPIIYEKKLKHFPITWSLVDGDINADYVFEIGKTIEKQDWFPVREVKPGMK